MVKCSDCGFLALRLIDGWTFVDADSEFRTMGSPRRSIVERYPVCFQRAFDLREEVTDTGAAEGTGEYNAVVVAMLNEERDCSARMPWHQGFTPKEHREMLDRVEARRFEVHQRAAAESRENRRDDKARQQEQDMREIDRRWRVIEFVGSLAAGAVIAIAAALAGAAAG